MFTGLVEEIGTVVSIETIGPTAKLTIDCQKVASDAKIGDSICNAGCCLTVVGIQETQLTFEAGEETLARTNLGRLQIGDAVNLERSVKPDNRLGGHFVSGHIDGQGLLVEREDQGDWSTLWFQVPSRLTRQMASKGSVAVDGISLTLVDVEENRFSVALIPHTLDVTTMGRRSVGDQVNIETDLLAKYVERQLQLGSLSGLRP